jgi:streptogramin lyase
MKGILRLGLLLVAVVALLAFGGGCSVWVMGVVQSFGSQNGPKISTIAGNGTRNYAGDGGPATNAELNGPFGLAVDSSGNLYIADSTNCVIRKVDPSGNITTVAGSYALAGTWAGDSGPATSAGLNSPLGVAVDLSGNIYIADTNNQVIRKVDHATGKISTVAGTHGASGFNGDSGAPTSVLLNYPYDVAVDSAGNLYIADSFNSIIRKLDPTGAIITTVAGNHSSGAGYTGDGRPATNAELNYPYGVAVDAAGNIYIADTTNHAIRKVDRASGNISTFAAIDSPDRVTVDSAGNLYVSQGSTIVSKVDSSGTISTVAGNAHLAAGYAGDGNVATAATLNEPWGVAIDSFGNLLIADQGNNRVRKVGIGQ